MIGPISIAMATYNGERFILEQLQSLANQDMLPTELVICDDTSTDATVDIIETFAKTAPFVVRLYRNETRLRFSDNFMKAIGLCRGRYIAFCDQDDIWHPAKISRSVESLQSSGALMCSHRVDLIDQDGTAIGASSNLSDYTMLRGSTFSPWGVFLGFTCTIDSQILKLIDPANRPADLIEYDRPMAHDRWFYFVAATFGAVSYIDEPLALYRQHDRNVFGRTRNTFLGRLRKTASKYPGYIGQRAVIASEVVRLLQRAQGDSANVELADSLGRWRRVAEFYAARRAIISQPSLYRRLRQLTLAYRGDQYRPGWGRGGSSLMVQDLIAAVIVR
jgi:glycosyltransferase involved in cell wall biosynthesis